MDLNTANSVSMFHKFLAAYEGS